MLETVAPTQPVQLRPVGLHESLAVQHFAAYVELDGPLVESTLRLRFANHLGRTIEADLIFPLPPSAALTGLKLRVGDRTIEGKVKARQKAQANYHRAVQAGQTAALAETDGQELARIRIAPIPAGEDVTVVLTVFSLLMPTVNGHRFVLPLTYMPPALQGSEAPSAVEAAALRQPRAQNSAARADLRIVVRHDLQGHAPSLRSPSHSITHETEDGCTVLTLQNLSLDRDFQLELQDRKSTAEPVLWVRHDPSNGPDGLGPSTAVALLPPMGADEAALTPRTVTFLVDRSGSMGGAPMEAAIRAVRGCLRALESQDQFNIIAFDDQLEALSPWPLPFTDSNLRLGDNFTQGIFARGGTSSAMALAASLDDVQRGNIAVHKPSTPASEARHRLRIVFFLTDGDVTGAAEVLRRAQEKLGDTRIFVIGIGPSVQHTLLGELAALGGGSYTPVAGNEDLERAIALLKNATSAPLWTGVRPTLDAEGERRSPKAIEPSGPLDLFASRPLLLAWRGALREHERLILVGQDPTGEDQRILCALDQKTLLTKLPEAEGGALERGVQASSAALVWALLRNRRLSYRFDTNDNPTLEGLGTDFGLVNREVALVAIDSQRTELQLDGTVGVSLPLPQNMAAPPPPPPPPPGNYPAGPPMSTLTGSAGAPYLPITRAQSQAAPMPMAPAPSKSFHQPFQPIAPSSPIRPGGLPPPAPAPRAAPAGPPSFGSGPPSFGAPPAPAPIVDDAFDSMVAEASDVEDDAPLAAPQTAVREASAQAFATPAEPAIRVKMAEVAKARIAPTFNVDAALRALVLNQNAEGLFGTSVAGTLAVVAALVSYGHSAREGLFMSELRRCTGALRTAAKSPGLEGVLATMALAFLQMPHGAPPPEGLAPSCAKALENSSLQALPALRNALRACLRELPPGWNTGSLAQQVCRDFQLL